MQKGKKGKKGKKAKKGSARELAPDLEIPLLPSMLATDESLRVAPPPLSLPCVAGKFRLVPTGFVGGMSTAVTHLQYLAPAAPLATTPPLLPACTPFICLDWSLLLLSYLRNKSSRQEEKFGELRTI